MHVTWNPSISMIHRIHGTNGIFTYIWLIFMVNVGKYTIHGSFGYDKSSPEKYFDIIFGDFFADFHNARMVSTRMSWHVIFGMYEALHPWSGISRLHEHVISSRLVSQPPQRTPSRNEVLIRPYFWGRGTLGRVGCQSWYYRKTLFILVITPEGASQSMQKVQALWGQYFY